MASRLATFPDLTIGRSVRKSQGSIAINRDKCGRRLNRGRLNDRAVSFITATLSVSRSTRIGKEEEKEEVQRPRVTSVPLIERRSSARTTRRDK